MDKSNNIVWDQRWIKNINPRKEVLEKELNKLEKVQEKYTDNKLGYDRSIYKRQNKIDMLKKELEKFKD